MIDRNVNQPNPTDEEEYALQEEYHAQAKQSVPQAASDDKMQKVFELLYGLVEHVFPDGAAKHELLGLITDELSDKTEASAEDQNVSEERKKEQEQQKKEQEEKAKQAEERQAKLRAMQERNANRAANR